MTYSYSFGPPLDQVGEQALLKLKKDMLSHCWCYPFLNPRAMMAICEECQQKVVLTQVQRSRIAIWDHHLYSSVRYHVDGPFPSCSKWLDIINLVSELETLLGSWGDGWGWQRYKGNPRVPNSDKNVVSRTDARAKQWHKIGNYWLKHSGCLKQTFCHDCHKQTEVFAMVPLVITIMPLAFDNGESPAFQCHY
jgi:hypothetical protein